MEKLKYNNPIEVTKNQYNIIMRDFKGIGTVQLRQEEQGVWGMLIELHEL